MRGCFVELRGFVYEAAGVVVGDTAYDGVEDDTPFHQFNIFCF